MMMAQPIAVRDPRARDTIQRWGELKQHRSKFEPDWEDISCLIRGIGGGHGLDDPQSRNMTRKALSSEPIVAQSSMAAGIYSAITNPANAWGGLETPDQDFNAWQPMADWTDRATRAVINSFRPEVSPFYSATLQAYGDLAAFGNAVGYDELDVGKRRFVDVTVNLAECVFSIDADGRVDELIRRYPLFPRAAVKKFHGKGQLPPKIHEMAEKGSTDRLMFYWHVQRNFSFEKGKLGPRGKVWSSRTVTEVDECLVRDSGYDDMPCYAPRWDVLTGDTYGRGPGCTALPAARVLDQLERAGLKAKQFAADPTLLAPDRDSWPLSGRVRPGSVLYGGVNNRGQAMVQPLQIGSVQMTDAERRAKIEEINKCFHYSMMPLTGRTGLTPEETRIIDEANLRNWAPNADRVMEEYGALKFMRRFRLLWQAGQIPPPPPEAEGLPLNVRYQSAATMAQRARNGMAVRQFIGDLGPLAALSPDHAKRVAARVDPDAAMEALHEASPSLPAKLLRDRQSADAAQEQANQADQQMQQLAMLQAGAGAAKDLGAAAGAMGMGAAQ